jgi:excisionase family DNA binding protein
METDERPVENEKLWMRVPEAATYFQVPRSRMYDLIQRGQLPAVRIGERSIRVNRTEVEKFLCENRRIDPSSV